MEMFSVLLLAAATLAAAVYAHVRLPALSASVTQLWITRLILVATGVGFGWVASTVQMQAEGLLRTLVFLSAFGVVHVPAAFILFVKGERRKP